MTTKLAVAAGNKMDFILQSANYLVILRHKIQNNYLPFILEFVNIN